MCAAAPISIDLIDAVYKRLKIPVYQAFGMTETAPATSMQTTATWEVGKGSVGSLCPNIQARVVGADGKDVESGEQGELWVKGPNVFVGYHNNPAATAECMTEDGFYKSGDIVRYDSQSASFFITDRIKELIKYKGFQVPPAELEGILAGHASVADVAVIGILDKEEETEVPRAYVVPQGGQNSSSKLENELVKFVEGRVAHYKRLRGGVHFVKEIPKNASGKILRRVLRQQAAEEAKKPKSEL